MRTPPSRDMHVLVIVTIPRLFPGESVMFCGIACEATPTETEAVSVAADWAAEPNVPVQLLTAPFG